MIDPEKTIWENISFAFTQKGLDLFPPATKHGECKSSYIVCKKDGTARVRNYSSEFDYYSFMMYVPKNKYNELDKFEKQVIEVINEELYPMLIPVGSKTPDFYDDEVKAHMRSIMYRNSVRNTKL